MTRCCASTTTSRQGTTFYSRLQFGHEVGGRGFGRLPAGLGAGSGDWPQMHNSYDINTVSSVNTLLHTFSPTTVLEVTVGRELVAPVRLPGEPGDARRQRPHEGAARAAAVLPAGEPDEPDPEHELRRHATRCRTRASMSVREPVSVLRVQPDTGHHEQPDEGHGPSQHEGGHLHRAQRASGARGRRASTARYDFDGNIEQPVRHELRLCERAARLDQQLHGVDDPSVRRGPVQPDRVLRPGQLAGDAALHARRRRAVLPHRVDVRRRPAGRPTSIRAKWNAAEGAAALRAGVPEQCGHLLDDDAPGAEPADRRDPEQHVRRQAGARVRATSTTACRSSTARRTRLGHRAGAARRASRGMSAATARPRSAAASAPSTTATRTTRSCRSSRCRRCMDTRTTNFTTIPQLLSSQLVQSTRSVDRLRSEQLPSADGLQLEHWRAARAAVQVHGRRGLCRQRQPIRLVDHAAQQHSATARRTTARPTDPERGSDQLLGHRLPAEGDRLPAAASRRVRHQPAPPGKAMRTTTPSRCR